MNAIEIRSSADGSTWTLAGLATSWSPYPVREPGASYSEQFTRGAFAGAVSGRDTVELRIEHDHRGAPLGPRPPAIFALNLPVVTGAPDFFHLGLQPHHLAKRIGNRGGQFAESVGKGKDAALGAAARVAAF